ncbi:MAG: DUF4340 domain-containing protein [Spirochaetaceae bacterium]|jgi:hypothetical protein|nr:DUF4340 domain-containing protein [Spirochaetaceae bacterium]
MGYKKKLTILLALTGFLGAVYVGSLVFDPERVNTRDASYRWLDPEQAGRADRIEISRPGEEALTLVRNNGGWFVARENAEYPAKEGRVEDFLRFFTTRASFPIRSASAASHERFGLTEAAAARIVIRAGSASLLDLLTGNGDALGRDLYLRRNSQDEVRSGEDRVSSYLNSAPSSWYMLRLFPETGSLSPDAVQRLTVSLPPNEEGEAGGTYTLMRDGGNWVREAGGVLDNPKVESYIRAVIEAEGEDFVPDMEPGDPVFTEGAITLSLGDGSTRFIRLGPVLESGSRGATVSGSSYVYALAAWTVNRIFRDAAEFGTP